MGTMLRSLVIFLPLLYCGRCQENAGTNVAPSLQECYNTTRYVTRDSRLPSTINVLVELVRKAEDGNPNLDAREIAISLLHRFRQDGIRKTWKPVDSNQVLPYSPKGWEAYKNRIQLIKITPGNAVNFNNDSLSHLQACSLHYMISSTIELESRNENDCPKTERYTSRIHKREAIELSETDSKSQCPIESGVIYTKWGAVKAGLLIGALAAGFQPNPITIDNVKVESSYASTIAGELAEAALNEPGDQKHVGNTGGWNSSVEPKYYFLGSNEKENLYLTDAEIRGGLDGLFIALNIDNWKSKSSNIKVSQILDLYYSRGVFNDSSRACNRKMLTDDLISNSKLVNQTVGFSKLLNDVAQLPYTISTESLPSMANAVTESLRGYIGSLNDVQCSAEKDLIERVSTDVLIFIDTAWTYDVIHPLVSYILEAIDVNKFESSYTIFDGANCNTIVNKSRSILDYYENYNLTQQQLYPTGFDYVKVIQTAEALFKAKLNNETDLTGQSTILLMLPHSSPTQSQSDFVRSKRSDFSTSLPDLRIIVGGPGSRTSYDGMVTTPTNDIITVNDDTSSSQIREAGRAVIERFQKLPRSIVNPSCGTSFQNEGSKNFEVTQYVEPTGINYHKISPNYFYAGQFLKIQGKGYGPLIVCTSRSDVNPKNATDGACKSISSDEVSLDISSYCKDEAVTNCAPIYISVQGQPSQTVRCSENTCRFPDNIKYSILLENVQCSSGSTTLITSFLIATLFLTLFIS